MQSPRVYLPVPPGKCQSQEAGMLPVCPACCLLPPHTYIPVLSWVIRVLFRPTHSAIAPPTPQSLHPLFNRSTPSSITPPVLQTAGCLGHFGVWPPPCPAFLSPGPAPADGAPRRQGGSWCGGASNRLCGCLKLASHVPVSVTLSGLHLTSRWSTGKIVP